MLIGCFVGQVENQNALNTPILTSTDWVSNDVNKNNVLGQAQNSRLPIAIAGKHTCTTILIIQVSYNMSTLKVLKPLRVSIGKIEIIDC